MIIGTFFCTRLISTSFYICWSIVLRLTYTFLRKRNRFRYKKYLVTFALEGLINIVLIVAGGQFCKT